MGCVLTRTDNRQKVDDQIVELWNAIRLIGMYLGVPYPLRTASELHPGLKRWSGSLGPNPCSWLPKVH